MAPHPAQDQSKDQHFMRQALRLGRITMGRTAPNPAVGCIIVKAGQVVGIGYTQPGGRPHAEAVALEQAGKQAQSATVYVTLEPCAHHGKTPPCSEALIAAGVARVVIAITDPDPRTSGKGIQALQSAGIAVSLGVCENEAKQDHAGFLLGQEHQRPFITLKLATSLDGKIATATGESKWITGETARAYAHYLRATHDAILVGGNTFRTDRPALTCRLPGLESTSPKRLVLHKNADTPGTTTEDGITHLNLQEDVSLKDTLRTLTQQHEVTRLLIEGGASVAALFLKQRLVDQLIWIQAPMLLGSEARSAIGALSIEELHHAITLQPTHTLALEKNVAHHFIPKKR